MDHIASGDRDLNVDLESGRVVDKSENEASVLIKSINHNKSEDPQLLASGRDERGKILGRAEMEEAGKEKCKKMSNKKPPRPPRPPRGPSLDAADQKLIREITELAKLKRARMERMRALKMANNARASSYSNKTVLALVFTVIVFLVVIFQGESSCLTWRAQECHADKFLGKSTE